MKRYFDEPVLTEGTICPSQFQPIEHEEHEVRWYYPDLVDVKSYPEYTKRPFPVCSWEDFEGCTQICRDRQMPSLSQDWSSPVKGRVFRPYIQNVMEPDFLDKLRYASKLGFWIHNIGGYGPGSPNQDDQGTYGFGEYILSEDLVKQIYEIVGNHFTGFDIGEQDGRFNFTFERIISPFPTDPRELYLRCQPFFDKIAEDQGELGSLLSVLWYWHYPVKEGYTRIIGAECQNKVTNMQIHYSFLRGAGKQYGVLWFGDISVFDPWGHKVYCKNTDDKHGGPNRGASLSLIKRSYYLQYMYNPTILCVEHNWLRGYWGHLEGETPVLSPIGELHNAVCDFYRTKSQCRCFVYANCFST